MRKPTPEDNPDHLTLDDHLTKGGFEEAIQRTYLGQAHIAGTGPEGKTCGDCIWWKHKQYLRQLYDKEGRWVKEVRVTPKDYDKDGNLRRHHCLRPILGKAKRRVPHVAEACRLFEQAPNPLPLKRAG
jgi:hypothetical protein